MIRSLRTFSLRAPRYPAHAASQSCLLVGTILRTVAGYANQYRRELLFYSKRDGVPNMRPLGSKAVAIETLKRDEALLKSVEHENTKRRNSLQGESLLQFYTVVAYHTLQLEEGNKDGFEVWPLRPHLPRH